MGHKKIQMTMRYAHLAPAHKLAAVDQLAAFNRAERTRQRSEALAILTPAGTENRTDTRTDTETKTGSRDEFSECQVKGFTVQRLPLMRGRSSVG